MPCFNCWSSKDPAQEAELGATFVLPQLTFGMCWTWDVVKTGRQPCQILHVHNTGLNSWEIPVWTKGHKHRLPQQTQLTWNRSRVFFRSKQPLGTTQGVWRIFCPIHTPEKPPQSKGKRVFAFSVGNLFATGKPTAPCQGGKPALPPRGSVRVLLPINYNGEEMVR